MDPVTLLQKRALCLNGTPHRLVEIEKYVYSEEHPDTCTHCHPDQLLAHHLYFHCCHKRIPRSYKGGTFKGLDLTFGTSGTNASSGVYAAYLIRSLQTPEGQVISGPCKCVNYILSFLGVDKIADLVQEDPLSYLDVDSPIRLIDYEWSTETMYSGPRIGLKYQDGISEAAYARLPYRYCILKKHVLKDKKNLLEYKEP